MDLAARTNTVSMKFKLAIPSLGRWEQIQCHPLLEYAHVVVQPHEEDQYRAMEKQPAAIHVLPQAIKGIGWSRHWIVENLWEKNEDCIWQADDDLLGLRYLMTRNPRLYRDPAYLMAVLSHVATAALDSPAGVMGFTRQSPQWRDAKRPFNHRDWSPSMVVGICDRELNFDQSLTSMEDVDLYIQGMAQNRVNWIDNRWRVETPEPWTNKGGMQTYRTQAVQDLAMEMLQDKWGTKAIGTGDVGGQKPTVLLTRGR
jgi:hypothetical protein